MTSTTHRTAVFDPRAFYPLRSLVEGEITDWAEIQAVERFVRTIVLHDDMVMELEPWGDPGIGDEEAEPGPRNIIVAIGPVLTSYEGLLSMPPPQRAKPTAVLPSNLLAVAQKLSGAGPGNPYYKAHVEFFQRLVATWQAGGSVVCDGEVARAGEFVLTTVPEELFSALDEDWQDYARAADTGNLGPVLPPVLAIALSRCKGRGDLPRVLMELRDEWGVARGKVWELIDQLRAARTLREANEIRRQFKEASRYFSPARGGAGASPLRVVWEVFAEVVGGAVDAGVAGGDPGVGGAVAGARAVISAAVRGGRDYASLVFRRGALDLARRVRRELMNIEPTVTPISRVLTPAEKSRLGL